MADSTTLNTARELTENVMGDADPNDNAHKLASALHLVIEALASAPASATPEQMRAAYEQAVAAVTARTATQSAALSSQPVPAGQYEPARAAQAEQISAEAAPALRLASVPPGLYEAPRNADGAVDTDAPASAPSIYEALRTEDGSLAPK